MKIAMIGHKRIPSREGGIEIVVEALSKRMVRRGHQVDAFNRKGKNALDATVETYDQEEYEGIRLISVPTFETKCLNAITYSLLATLKAVFGKYDVIHYHAEGPSVMVFIPHLFHIRTVVTIHGLDWQRDKWGNFASRYIKFGERMAAKYADEVVVLSLNVKRYFWEKYHRETHYIPNGIEPIQFRKPSIINTNYGLKQKDYLLFLGRIVPEKGLHYLIEAYQSLQGEKPKLVIAGAPSHTSGYYHQIVQAAGEDPNILFTGFVQGKELAELYSNCLGYVLPSDVEGMPISLLDAMAYGKPCVVSDIEEIQEVIGEDAFSFRKGDVEDLARALRELFCYVEAQEFAYPEGKMKPYNWEHIVEQYIKLYEKDTEE